MATLGNFLNGLAQKAGIEQNDELKKLLENQSLTQIEVPENLVSELNQNLFTADAAKNDPKIRDHFFSQFADRFDQKIKQSLESAGYGSDKWEELKNNYKDSSERASKALELLKRDKEKEFEELKKKSSGSEKEKERIQELEKHLEELKAERDKIKQEKDSELQTYEQKLKETQKQRQIDRLLAKYPINPNIPESMRQEVAFRAIQDGLRKQGADMVEENGELKVVDSENPQFVKYDQNKNPLEPESFVKNVLDQNELLVKSNGNDPEPSKAGSTNQNGNTGGNQNAGAGANPNQDGGASAVKSAFAASREWMNKQNSN
jgi:DNA repair exonuclease SbcCD ATPase subunit